MPAPENLKNIHDDQYIDFIVSANMISKQLKANLTLNQERIFAMNVLLENGQSSKFRANFVIVSISLGCILVFVPFPPDNQFNLTRQDLAKQ